MHHGRCKWIASYTINPCVNATLDKNICTGCSLTNMHSCCTHSIVKRDLHMKFPVIIIRRIKTDIHNNRKEIWIIHTLRRKIISCYWMIIEKNVSIFPLRSTCSQLIITIPCKKLPRFSSSQIVSFRWDRHKYNSYLELKLSLVK